ncbi:MAG: hypothetical protein R6U98_13045 [Pirellulaceae bacterium]
MDRCPAQAVLPLVGLAADRIIRDRYNVPRRPLLRSRQAGFGRESVN